MHGLSFGSFVDIPINKYLSIQVEINNHEKGSDRLVEFIEFYDAGSSYSYDLYFKENIIYGFKLQYLELPVILKVHTINFYNFNPVLYCGIAASVNHKAEMWIKDGGISENISIIESEEDIGESIEHYDYNALFGFELGYHINRLKIFCDLRYNLGLVEIYEDKDVELDFTNSTFTSTIGFGYELRPLKKISNQSKKIGYK